VRSSNSAARYSVSLSSGLAPLASSAAVIRGSFAMPAAPHRAVGVAGGGSEELVAQQGVGHTEREVEADDAPRPDKQFVE
jgi:hypothetical protein